MVVFCRLGLISHAKVSAYPPLYHVFTRERTNWWFFVAIYW